MKKLIITALAAMAAGFTSYAQTPAGEEPKENKNQAEITFEKEVNDFGIVPQGTPASYTFVFRNTGKEPLIITNATASCGCTTPEWTKEPIKKGDKGFVKATYNATAAGAFNKSLTVLSNAKRGTVVLTIKGEVKAPEYVTPTPGGGDKTIKQ